MPEPQGFTSFPLGIYPSRFQSRLEALLQEIDASLVAGGWDEATCAEQLADDPQAAPAKWATKLRAHLAARPTDQPDPRIAQPGDPT